MFSFFKKPKVEAVPVKRKLIQAMDAEGQFHHQMPGGPGVQFLFYDRDNTLINTTVNDGADETQVIHHGKMYPVIHSLINGLGTKFTLISKSISTAKPIYDRPANLTDFRSERADQNVDPEQAQWVYNFREDMGDRQGEISLLGGLISSERDPQFAIAERIGVATSNIGNVVKGSTDFELYRFYPTSGASGFKARTEEQVLQEGNRIYQTDYQNAPDPLTLVMPLYKKGSEQFITVKISKAEMMNHSALHQSDGKNFSMLLQLARYGYQINPDLIPHELGVLSVTYHGFAPEELKLIDQRTVVLVDDAAKESNGVSIFGFIGINAVTQAVLDADTGNRSEERRIRHYGEDYQKRIDTFPDELFERLTTEQQMAVLSSKQQKEVMEAGFIEKISQVGKKPYGTMNDKEKAVALSKMPIEELAYFYPSLSEPLADIVKRCSDDQLNKLVRRLSKDPNEHCDFRTFLAFVRLLPRQNLDDRILSTIDHPFDSYLYKTMGKINPIQVLCVGLAERLQRCPNLSIKDKERISQLAARVEDGSVLDWSAKVSPLDREMNKLYDMVVTLNDDGKYKPRMLDALFNLLDADSARSKFKIPESEDLKPVYAIAYQTLRSAITSIQEDESLVNKMGGNEKFAPVLAQFERLTAEFPDLLIGNVPPPSDLRVGGL